MKVLKGQQKLNLSIIKYTITCQDMTNSQKRVYYHIIIAPFQWIFHINSNFFADRSFLVLGVKEKSLDRNPTRNSQYSFRYPEPAWNLEKQEYLIGFYTIICAVKAIPTATLEAEVCLKTRIYSRQQIHYTGRFRNWTGSPNQA